MIVAEVSREETDTLGVWDLRALWIEELACSSYFFIETLC
jgi:hypothetical protein